MTNSFTVRPAVGRAWRRYVDGLVDSRPAMHAYCYRLTGNVWDGEDLVQDTLVRVSCVLGRTDVVQRFATGLRAKDLDAMKVLCADQVVGELVGGAELGRCHDPIAVRRCGTFFLRSSLAAARDGEEAACYEARAGDSAGSSVGIPACRASSRTRAQSSDTHVEFSASARVLPRVNTLAMNSFPD